MLPLKHGRAVEGDPSHEQLQPRERGEVLHQLRRQGWTVAGAQAARGGKTVLNGTILVNFTCLGGKPAGHNQAQNEDLRL